MIWSSSCGTSIPEAPLLPFARDGMSHAVVAWQLTSLLWAWCCWRRGCLRNCHWRFREVEFWGIFICYKLLYCNRFSFAFKGVYRFCQLLSFSVHGVFTPATGKTDAFLLMLEVLDASGIPNPECKSLQQLSATWLQMLPVDSKRWHNISSKIASLLNAYQNWHV